MSRKVYSSKTIKFDINDAREKRACDYLVSMNKEKGQSYAHIFTDMVEAAIESNNEKQNIVSLLEEGIEYLKAILDKLNNIDGISVAFTDKNRNDLEDIEIAQGVVDFLNDMDD